jgi:hypothetical protein
VQCRLRSASFALRLLRAQQILPSTVAAVPNQQQCMTEPHTQQCCAATLQLSCCEPARRCIRTQHYARQCMTKPHTQQCSTSTAQQLCSCLQMPKVMCIAAATAAAAVRRFRWKLLAATMTDHTTVATRPITPPLPPPLLTHQQL